MEIVLKSHKMAEKLARLWAEEPSSLSPRPGYKVSDVSLFPTEVSIRSLQLCYQISQRSRLHFSFQLWLAFKQIILENKPQSEENKLGSLLKKHCKWMSLLVFQANRLFGLITRNLLCERKLFGCSFYRLNCAHSMHPYPTYPFWIVPPVTLLCQDLWFSKEFALSTIT